MRILVVLCVIVLAGCAAPVDSNEDSPVATLQPVSSATVATTPSPGAQFPVFEPLEWDEDWDAEDRDFFVALRHVTGGCVDPRDYVWTINEGGEEFIGRVYQMYEWGDIDESDPIENWCVREVHALLAQGVAPDGRDELLLVVYDKADGKPVFELEIDEPVPTPTAPAISWNKNESQDKLSVVTASGNADWSKLVISSSVNSQFTLNGGLAKNVNSTPTAMATSSTPVRAGDDLIFCRSGGPGPLEIQITDPAANQIVKEESYTAAAC